MAARVIAGTKKQDEFFQLLGDPKTLDSDRVVKLFAWTKAGNGIRFYVDDVIEIGPKETPFWDKKGYTTVGIYIVNKFIIEDLKVFGYINREFNDKTFGKLEDNIAKALTAGDITTQQVFDYIDRASYLFGGPLAHIINTSLSSTTLSLPPQAKKLREQMLAENRDKIDKMACDPNVTATIEKAVVDKALEEMEKTGDPSLVLYTSGCGVDPYNNYRTMFVMKGAVIDNTGLSPTGYKFVESNYDDGVSKDDLPIIADTLVRSAYMSGVATQDSGASAKNYNIINQRVRLQDRGSFCHTSKTLSVKLTEKNKSMYIYRYIKTSAKEPVLLDDENIDKHVGTTVQMYTPLHCKAKDPEYCSICAGDRPYRIGVRNVGLTFSIMTGSTMNAMLKTKHDTTVKPVPVSIDDITKYIDHPLK